MKVLETGQDMALARREAVRPMGLVPTMGALHQGHLALVQRAREENVTLAASIFVNPTQFSAGEDLQQYPRDLDRDLELLRGEGADLVFVPAAEEVYPPGFDTWVSVGGLSEKLEGAQRPGHFRGVATVVTKLLNVMRPNRVYLGQKDGQQTAVIRQLLRDLDMGVELVVVPTVREEDGLACSSRNAYLDRQQRQAAPVVFRALTCADTLWRCGETGGDRLRSKVRQELEREPLVTGIDYVSVADPDSLEELDTVTSRAMVSTAVRMGKVRLIDNVVLE